MRKVGICAALVLFAIGLSCLQFNEIASIPATANYQAGQFVVNPDGQTEFWAQCFTSGSLLTIMRWNEDGTRLADYTFTLPDVNQFPVYCVSAFYFRSTQYLVTAQKNSSNICELQVFTVPDGGYICSVSIPNECSLLSVNYLTAWQTEDNILIELGLQRSTIGYSGEFSTLAENSLSIRYQFNGQLMTETGETTNGGYQVSRNDADNAVTIGFSGSGQYDEMLGGGSESYESTLRYQQNYSSGLADSLVTFFASLPSYNSANNGPPQVNSYTRYDITGLITGCGKYGYSAHYSSVYSVDGVAATHDSLFIQLIDPTGQEPDIAIRQSISNAGNTCSGLFADGNEEYLLTFFSGNDYILLRVCDGEEYAGAVPGFYPAVLFTNTEGDVWAISVEDDSGNRILSRLEGIVQSDDTAIPTRPILAMFASPNPFNPSTTIAYSLPSAGDTTLRIYNTRGQMVKTLVHEQLEAGNHSVTWDGMDDKGKPVASGVYLVRLATPVGSQFSKCILLK
jgi:hypothetical protein